MLTLRLLQVYLFLLPLEELLGKLFGIDTMWKPYRVAAMLVAVVAVIELPYRKLDKYDKNFLAIFLTACGLSSISLIRGVPEPAFVLRTCVLVLIPISMYFCIKLNARTPADLARLIRAFILGAFVNACYGAYEAITLGHTWRPAGLSGAAAPADLALHCGLAFAFVLYPYPGRRRATWLSVFVRVSAGAVLLFAVLVSGTRGAWLGLVFSTAALACVMALSRSQRGRMLRVLAPATILITVALVFKFAPLLKRAEGDLTDALESRLAWDKDLQTGAGRTEIWGQALDIASDYYFIGGGFSGFLQASYNHTSAFHGFNPAWLVEHGIGSHDVFLEVLIDYGPTSLLLLVASLTTLIGSLFRKARDANRELSPHGMLYSLLFLIVCGLSRDLISMPDFWIVMAFVTLFVRYRSCPAKARIESIISRGRINRYANRMLVEVQSERGL